MGVKHKELEARLLDYLKVKKIVLFLMVTYRLNVQYQLLELKGK